MPSFDVKLQFDILEKQSHNVIKNNNADLFKISDSSSGTNELTSYVKGTKLYMVLNMNEYQFAFYNSVKIEWSYTLNGETTTDSYTFTSKKDWNPIQSAPDCDLTFTLILSEPTEKVTINKEDTDQKAKLGISTSYSSYDFFDFGDNFEIKKGKGLYAVLTSYETSDFSGGKYVINITNSDTNEIVKTLNITSSYGSKYVYFTADSNLIISLTYVQNN